MRFSARASRESAEYEILCRAVDSFAAKMKLRLLEKIREGRVGWDDPSWRVEDIATCVQSEGRRLRFVDAANFALFGWNRE